MGKKFYLVGENIAKSYSPIIHGIIYRELNLDAEYFLFEPSARSNKQDIGKNLYKNGLVLPLDFDGLNITHPYKGQIVDLLDFDCSGCGSVNTIIRRSNIKNKLFGYSTDGDGFLLDALRLGLDLTDVLLIGTGGAARSIAHSLKEHYLESNSKGMDFLSVFSRSPQRAEQFASEFNIKTYKKDKTYSLVINCTPMPLAVDIFRAKEYYDLKYTDGGDGLGMLIYQAILSDCMFFEKEIDLKIFDLIYKNIKDL